MEYIGSYGEHLTLANLLQHNIESYLAIKSNQKDYDITVIVNANTVKRVQVKSTDLQNLNTNNSISGTEKTYDYLVLVIIDKENPRSFILTKEEVETERGSSVKFSCSRKEKGESIVKESLLKFENKWEKIQGV